MISDLLKMGSDKPRNNSIFKEDNPMGYFTKPEFKSNLELLGSEQTTHYLLRNLDDFFGIAKVGLPFNRKPNHTINNGMHGSWLSTQAGKVKTNIFIAHFGEMQRFIDEYAAGRLKIDRTLEEYYKEACGE
ncbi:hypothetical protein [Pedobacter sp. SL55]|uniref:hypothetical protein n=1 Tax=Pedobacter sp. SL55 TaxID=2995161 RepID=UPI002271A6F7|nr:hypothetical protein [Pedobacter sp. SL55]WAC41077.1 hypothetical protein OVA16_01485 [Pedobacter sp. SL55]